METDQFTKCKVCNWTGKQLQRHLNNNTSCRSKYDMDEVNAYFANVASKKKKERNRLYYDKNREKLADQDHKEVRAKNYQEHKEDHATYYQEHKEDRAEYYQEHKEMRAEYYQEHREEKLEYQKSYDQENKKHLHAKKELSHLNDPKLKKYIGNEFNDYVQDAEIHLYLHAHGICHKDTLRTAKHRVEKGTKCCDKCSKQMFSVLGTNKLYCIDGGCQEAKCKVCDGNIEQNPFEGRYFYFCPQCE